MLSPNIPEVFYAFLGSLKARVVVCPLFINYREPALQDRLADAEARVLVTKRSLLRKVARVRDRVPTPCVTCWSSIAKKT